MCKDMVETFELEPYSYTRKKHGSAKRRNPSQLKANGRYALYVVRTKTSHISLFNQLT